MSAGRIVPFGNGPEYSGKLTLYVLVTCMVAAMGGLLFGYDIASTGGVTSMPSFLRKFFPSVYAGQQRNKSTNQFCQSDRETVTQFSLSLYLAAILASLVASIVTRRYGRKLSMLFSGLLFFAGALINGFATALWMVIVGRILLGFGVGFANQDGWCLVKFSRWKSGQLRRVSMFLSTCFPRILFAFGSL
ncbi:hypothetical protein SLEP1_g15369 [Rubroshorea leprosula]|uniref:Major facilitator superfamily (MFS) profile domain-containing protein n=1 Tax=Rubroshorea leprosula TaxID=152421 RepID=A0AAV5IM46_9ROSI|nr:hypothetical protein SLEP1_g15369 [Rubroshorea leprosula]